MFSGRFPRAQRHKQAHPVPIQAATHTVTVPQVVGTRTHVDIERVFQKSSLHCHEGYREESCDRHTCLNTSGSRVLIISP